MKDLKLKKIIDSEFKKSETKLNSIKISDISSLAKKTKILSDELKKLNEYVPKVANKYISDNNINESEMPEINKYIEKKLSDIINAYNK